MTGAVLDPRIRVFLVDDHRVFAESLALSIDTQPDLLCVGVAHTVADGLQLVGTTPCDVVLLDLHLPDLDGFAAIPQLLARRADVKIIVLTAHPRPGLAQRALAAGVSGFLGKDARLGEIVDGVRAAAAGRLVVGPGLDADQETEVRLTPRELEVLQALRHGLDATRIASVMGISLYTSRDHIRAVMGKLGVSTQLDAVVTADRLGLVTLGTGF